MSRAVEVADMQSSGIQHTTVEQLEQSAQYHVALVELARTVANMDILDIMDYLGSQRKRKWREQMAGLADVWAIVVGGELKGE